MVEKVLFTLLLFCLGALSKDKFTCKDDAKFLWLHICVIEDFSYDDLNDLSEDSFPNATQLEIQGTYFPYFGSHMFNFLPETLRQLTFRKGYVREINLQPTSSLERLRVIHTDLVTLDAVSEPNHSLKELTIRSPVFSRWSSSLQFLKALEVVDVAYCNFTHINAGWFVGNANLRLLDVSNNRVQTLASLPGQIFPALKELYVWNNQLEFLWRFPDAFPNLLVVNLSGNWWRCGWVTLAREAIHDRGITVIDSDYSCPKGWIRNGGLCCRMPNVPSNYDKSNFTDVVVEYIMDQENGKVIGMRMGDSVIYLDQPISG